MANQNKDTPGSGVSDTQVSQKSAGGKTGTVPTPNGVASVEHVSYLEDVTGGEDIPGYSPEEEAFGTVVISEKNGVYMLNADFENLPVLGDGFFYEGWLVDTSTGGSVTSTGEAVLNKNGVHVNEATFDNVAIMMYKRYVLTLEPRDGDPALATHILAGPLDWEMQNNNSGPSTGIFQDYDPALLANARDGDVIIFFTASWCPTCNALTRDINNNLDKIPADVSILKVDYDTSTAMKKKYNVRIQHTLVQVDENGNELTKWNGSLTLERLLSQII